MNPMRSSSSLLRLGCLLTLAVALAAPCAAQVAVERVVQASNKFLGTLTDAQRAKVLYDFNDKAQRARWSNFPTGFVPRGGINLKSMSSTQKAAALDLLKIVLSPMGYERSTRSGWLTTTLKPTGPGGVHVAAVLRWVADRRPTPG